MQRPTSVTVFGVLNIVFGALGLLSTAFTGAAVFLAEAQQRQMPGVEELNPVWEGWLRIIVVVSIVAAFVLITSGFGLLGLRRWGRVLAIVYAVYAITSCALGVVMQYVFVAQPLLEQQDNPNNREAAMMMVGVSLVSSCAGLIYPLLLWYFMSRPHVVAAFNGLSAPVDVSKGRTPPVHDVWGPLDASNPYAASEAAGPAPPVVGGQPFSATESIVETFVPSRNGAALVAYYCGIFALFPCLGFPLGVVAVVYGLKGLRAERENPAVRGGVHAWVGVICGALFGFFNFLLCVVAVIGIFAAIFEGK
jgi:hypothetical protein